jgi:uncharacterized protein (TIGR02246 family)
MTNSSDSEPHDVLRRLRDAWNAADAAAFAAAFTEDATYVIWRGDALTGRGEIQRAHQELFARSPSRIRVSVIDSRLLGDSSAVVLTAAGTGDGDVDYDNLQTFVLTRRDDGWLVAAFHNTAMSDRSKSRYRHAPDM